MGNSYATVVAIALSLLTSWWHDLRVEERFADLESGYVFCETLGAEDLEDVLNDYCDGKGLADFASGSLAHDAIRATAHALSLHFSMPGLA